MCVHQDTENFGAPCHATRVTRKIVVTIFLTLWHRIRIRLDYIARRTICCAWSGSSNLFWAWIGELIFRSRVSRRSILVYWVIERERIRKGGEKRKIKERQEKDRDTKREKERKRRRGIVWISYSLFFVVAKINVSLVYLLNYSNMWILYNPDYCINNFYFCKT